jgi:hypothetical protein
MLALAGPDTSFVACTGLLNRARLVHQNQTLVRYLASLLWLRCFASMC